MAAPAGGGGSSQGGEGGRPRQPQATRGGRGERECHRRCERFPVGRPHITNPTPSPSTLAARRPCCPALPAVADRVWRRRRASPQNGVTALMCAATSGKLDCLEHLTAKGANLEAVTSKVSAALCEPPPPFSAPYSSPSLPAALAAPLSPPPLTRVALPLCLRRKATRPSLGRLWAATSTASSTSSPKAPTLRRPQAR